MWCGICNNHLSKCICDDLEERLRSVASGGHFAYSEFKKCKKHFERCKCEEPELVTICKISSINN